MNTTFTSDSGNAKHKIVYRLLLLVSLLYRYGEFDQEKLEEVYDVVSYFCLNLKGHSSWHFPVIAMGYLFTGCPSLMVFGS
jgi:hypothetical protein